MAYEKNLSSGLYNIQGSETKTVREIVSEIHHFMGKEVPKDCFGSVHRADASMKYLALDGTKLLTAIGFQAKKRIIDMISTYY